MNAAPTLFDLEVGAGAGAACDAGADAAPASGPLTELDDPVRSTDPDTSAAAAAMVRDTSGNDRLAVMDAIHRLGGAATTDQIRDELARVGIRRDRNCVASRISQLTKARHGARLEDSGDRATITKGRPPVIVWKATGR